MKTIKKIAASVTALGTLLMVKSASALSVSGGSTFDLGSADLQDTVISIIQWVLGLLGLIAVIMILIGGFKWMTAGGNEEKIEGAKKLLTAAIIGLVIVLLAWAIVIFAVNVLTNSTN